MAITPQHIRFGFENSELYTTELHTAALENNVQRVRTLLKQGANPFITTIESIPRTALEYAERFDCLDTAKVLRDFMDRKPHLASELLQIGQ